MVIHFALIPVQNGTSTDAAKLCMNRGAWEQAFHMAAGNEESLRNVHAARLKYMQASQRTTEVLPAFQRVLSSR